MGGIASIIADKMDKGEPAEGSDTGADDTDGDSAAQESAASDFASAVKAGDAPGIVSALKELLDLIKE